MKKKYITMTVVYFGILLLANNPVSAQDNFTPGQLKEDFILFRQAMQEAHPGLYRYNTKEHVDSLFAKTESLLDNEMTQQEFYRVLLPLASQVKCGHTKFHPDNNWSDYYYYGSERVFPLRLFFQDKKAFILDSYDSSIIAPKGLEVTSINRKPMTMIIDRLLPAFFSDGNNTTFKYIEMSKFFSAYYANLIEAPDSFSIICIRDNAPVEMNVASISRATVDNYEKRQALVKPDKGPYFLEFPSDKVALLTIASFWMESGEKGYKKFLKESFAEINGKSIQQLIIDVRNNEGGKDARGALLLAYLMDTKFRYYDRLTATTNKKYSFAGQARLPRFYGVLRMLISRTDSGTFEWKHNRNLKMQKPRKNPFSGKVYVLINGASFSVTSEFASVAHYLKRATFVGEETGGGYYGNNSGTFVIVTLPNSRLNLGIPMLAYYTAVQGYQLKDHGIIPDHPVTPAIQDVLSGKDVVLNFTLQLINNTITD
jgi:hypothetical protein